MQHLANFELSYNMLFTYFFLWYTIYSSLWDDDKISNQFCYVFAKLKSINVISYIKHQRTYSNIKKPHLKIVFVHGVYIFALTVEQDCDDLFIIYCLNYSTIRTRQLEIGRNFDNSSEVHCQTVDQICTANEQMAGTSDVEVEQVISEVKLS